MLAFLLSFLTILSFIRSDFYCNCFFASILCFFSGLLSVLLFYKYFIDEKEDHLLKAYPNSLDHVLLCGAKGEVVAVLAKKIVEVVSTFTKTQTVIAVGGVTTALVVEEGLAHHRRNQTAESTAGLHESNADRYRDANMPHSEMHQRGLANHTHTRCESVKI